MPRELAMHDHYVDVLGLKSSDSVLVFGNSMFTDLKNVCPRSTTARKGSDLTRLVKENAAYDRIIVSKDIEISEVGMRKLMSMNNGLICYFVGSQADEDGLMEYLMKNHPWADVWALDTNVGRAVVTSAKGAPEWLD